jgi:polysaccharide biosynthesis protein PslA
MNIGVELDEARRSSPTTSNRNSKERLRLRLYAWLVALDVGAITLGFLTANIVRFTDPFAEDGIQCVSMILPLFVVLAFSGRCYAIEVLGSPRVGVGRALKAFVLTGSVLLLILFSVKTTSEVSRIVVTTGFVASAILLAVLRYGFGQLIGKRYEWNFVKEVLIVDGMAVLPKKGHLVLFADHTGISPDMNDPISFHRIGRLLSNCDRVILACEPNARRAWSDTLKGAGIAVEVLTPELDHLGALELRNVGTHTAVLTATGPLGLRDRLLKRALDLSITVPALIIASPLMLAIAVAIKLTSPGPVLFRQPRIGQSNRIFPVLKFRSMRIDSADVAGMRSASKDDDRITRVGRIIRATSVDELPQLFNVLIGQMSIVGPRPHALGSTAENDLFWHIDSRYWQRGAVLPGITGLAQVRGFRGATGRREDLTNRLQADLEYLSNWSIWKDIGIIARTVRVMIHPQAY